ncbi:MAG TPA: glycerophosphodiester phosphodiesterase family protein [Allosphingosinicella sp.]|jgi:glycerophosphoryl diester phosphodiesterase|uniref:glycerophosphodiester phosphodiesterase family protein n=1 Tax=Allosphingosinicella sp. TaxID=2823234 RepID=UPI002F2A55D7
MRLSLSSRIDEALAPAPRPRRVEGLKPLPFAHRGLHGPGRPENSLAAFRAAIEAGHGVELDVRASRDGHAIVFHDAELDRLTGERGPIAVRTAAELTSIPLRDGDGETIPDLPTALSLIRGRVPLLIEVKAPDPQVGALCLSAFRALDGYLGPVGVMSFNPEVGRWFARHAPRITSGLVVTEAGKRRRGGLRRRLALWRARPDFLAYDIRDLPSPFASRARARGLPVFTWTCRSAADQAKARLHADQIIHELHLAHPEEGLSSAKARLEGSLSFVLRDAASTSLSGSSG